MHPELPPDTEVLHWPALPAEIGVIRRAAELSGSGIGPRCRVEHNRGVGIETVAVEVFQIQGFAGHSDLVLCGLKRQVVHGGQTEVRRVTEGVGRGWQERNSAGVIRKRVDHPVADYAWNHLAGPPLR